MMMRRWRRRQSKDAIHVETSTDQRRPHFTARMGKRRGCDQHGEDVSRIPSPRTAAHSVSTGILDIDEDDFPPMMRNREIFLNRMSSALPCSCWTRRRGDQRMLIGLITRV